MLKLIIGFLFVLTGTFSGLANADVVVQSNPHPAAQMVADTLNQAMRIARISNSRTKAMRMCSLVKTKFGHRIIGRKWLGEFAQLRREQAAVSRFIGLVPSIIVSRVMEALGAETGGRAEVDAGVRTVSRNVVSVGVRLTNSRGQSYNGTVLVNTANGYKLVDGRYMGFSAVDYMGREYQRMLNAEYNKDTNRSRPVGELVSHVQSEDGFIRCP